MQIYIYINRINFLDRYGFRTKFEQTSILNPQLSILYYVLIITLFYYYLLLLLL